MKAPLVLDWTINRAALETNVEKVLVPELRPGDIVVMGNLSSHEGKGVHQSIDAAGATTLLRPPHSPDLDLIEMVFANLHTLLRNSAERTVDDSWIAIECIFDTFHPREC